MAEWAKWFRNQLPGEGFVAGLCTIESPDANYSLIRTTDVLESDSVPEFYNVTHKITCSEWSFRMNGDSI